MEWLEHLNVGTDGILRRRDGRVAVGAVLLIANDAGKIVVVTKVHKTAYEFSGLDVLPGGLLRAQGHGQIGPTDLRRITIESLSARAVAEAGFLLKAPPTAMDLQIPPTTSYLDRGVQQYVVVLPYITRTTPHFSPAATDRSVSAARWADPVAVVPNLAPANCIIVSSFLWPQLNTAERDACRPAVEVAAASCNEWAKAVAIPPVDLSWL